jgi:hypothetical protein
MRFSWSRCYTREAHIGTREQNLTRDAQRWLRLRFGAGG